MDPEFTNNEQIQQCKALQKQAIYSKFEEMVNNHRIARHFQMKDCFNQSQAYIDQNLDCILEYIEGIKKDNAAMVSHYKQDFKQYL